MIFVRKRAGFIVFLIALLLATAFALLAFRTGQFDPVAAAVGGAGLILIVAFYNILVKCYRHLDRFALIIPLFLACMGLIIQFRLGSDYGIKQLITLAVGMAGMVAAIEITRRQHGFGKWNWVFMGACLLLLASTLVFSRVIGGAKNWLSIGGVSFQPSEFSKLLYIVVTAYFFSTRQRVREMIPFVAFAVVCVVVLVVAKDLGTALLYALTFIVMFYVSTGRKLLTAAALSGLAGGAVVSYFVFDHVKTRVDVWLDPWSRYQTSGYQIVQGLMALASGGFLGMGLTLGYPGVIPAARTDYAFAVICEEFGVVVGIFIICFYLLFIVRGALIAMDARDNFDKILVFGVTAMLCLQCFVIIGGVIKLIPLTGVTLPFVSAGGSSMLTSMMLVGVMEGVAIKSGAAEEAELAKIGGEIR